MDRISLLKYLFKEKSKYDIVLDYLAQKTEGFVVQDLADFVDKAIFECLKDGRHQKLSKITEVL